ncbi:MAG: protein-export chaperone SecB [Prevotella sp.]|nr:protein-export chaperone SecB [Prevotella sp.]
MENAAFKIDSYHFTKASLNFDIPDNATLNIEIFPSGVYHQSEGRFVLDFVVKIVCEENQTEVVNVNCRAVFLFSEQMQLEEIPGFFYPNSLAIVFPYVRAFVSTITLQANVHPVILPTLNLMGLTEELRSNTRNAE